MAKLPTDPQNPERMLYDFFVEFLSQDDSLDKLADSLQVPRSMLRAEKPNQLKTKER